MRRALTSLPLLAALLFAASTQTPNPTAHAWAQAKTGQETGLPLPRFVTLRFDEANLRSGPGLRYPIRWIYRRAGLPVEIVAESGNWRKLRDWEGAEGWMHQSMLSGERGAMVTGTDRFILRDPDPDSRAVAQFEAGVIAQLESCEGAWCEISAAGHRGWLRRDEIYGVHPGEEVE